MQANSLAIYQKVDNPIAFAESFAKPLAAMLNCNEAQGQAAALTCLCENLTPVEFVRRYHMIQGKPTMRADAMLAELRLNHGGDFEIVERSPERAAIKLTQDDKTFEAEFTWEEAQQSRWPWNNWRDHDKGLKDNWATPTDRRSMLWARLVSDSLRAFLPELAAGVYTPEEMGDVIDSTATVVSSTPMSASEFFDQENGEAAPAAVSEVVDVEPEPPAAEPPESSGRFKRLQSLFEKAYGDNAPQAIAGACQNRKVESLLHLGDAAVEELQMKLEAKIAAGN